MDREEALKLAESSVSKKNLFKHMLATEVAMRSLAERVGGDPDKWALAGLLHDIDYDQTENDFPNHALIAGRILEEKGIDTEIIRAVMAHPNHEGYPPQAPMDWALHAVDGLTGLIVASALMHPDKKLKSIDVEFVMRRFGEKRFAAGANREQIMLCEKIGLSIEEFISITLSAMQSIDKELGL